MHARSVVPVAVTAVAAAGAGASVVISPLVLAPVAGVVGVIAAGRRRALLFAFGLFVPLLVSSGLINSLASTSAGATIQKAAVAVFMLLLGATAGVRQAPKPIAWILGVFGASLFITLWSMRSTDLLNSGEAVRAAMGFALPWLIFFIRWRNVRAEQLMKLVAILPLAAILVGAALDVGGLHPLIWTEYTGARRLTGGLSAAYLGSFGMFGAFTAMWLWRSGYRYGLWLAVLNIAITFATGTRGPALAALVMVWLAVMFTGRGGRRVTVIARGAVLALALAAVAVFVPVLIERTTSQGSLQGPLSGRDKAWAYFWEVFTHHPVLGSGIGASSVAGEDSGQRIISAAFVAPHNTYLQFLVDFGVVGTVICLWAVIALFRYARQNTTGHTRLMVGVLGLTMAFYAFFDNLLTSPQPAFAFTLVLATLIHDGRSRTVSGEDLVFPAVGVGDQPGVIDARRVRAGGPA